MGNVRKLPISAALTRILELGRDADVTSEPEVPRAASTVVLLRDSPEGLQCFLARTLDDPGIEERDRLVFPMAEVRADEATRVPLSVWQPNKMASTLHMSNATKALQYYVAAARALLQTCGLLLADDVDSALISERDTPLWDRSRRDVVSGRVSFPDMLAERELRMRADLLHPWMRWVNARSQLKRFDTMVFVCSVPPGQQVDFVTSTHSWGGWMTPAEALSDVRWATADAMPAMVRIMLEDLATIRTVGMAMVRVNDVGPLLPEVSCEEGGWRLRVALPDTMSGKTMVRKPLTWETSADQRDEQHTLVDSAGDTANEPGDD